MHELSIALSIIEMAEEEIARHHAEEDAGEGELERQAVLGHQQGGSDDRDILMQEGDEEQGSRDDEGGAARGQIADDMENRVHRPIIGLQTRQRRNEGIWSREPAHPDSHPDDHHQELGEDLHIHRHLATLHIQEEHGADLVAVVPDLMGKSVVP